MKTMTEATTDAEPTNGTGDTWRRVKRTVLILVLLSVIFTALRGVGGEDTFAMFVAILVSTLTGIFVYGGD